MSDTENQEIDNEHPVESEITQEAPPAAEKLAEEKPVSTRDAIKNALKEAKEKDEKAATTATTEHTKPVRAAKDDKTAKPDASSAVQETTEAAKPVEGPKSWPASERTEFAKLPANIQNLINEREKSFETTIGKSGQAAEFGNRIKDIVTPYAAIITAEGGTPEKAIQELMNSAYVLRRGTPQEKARMVIKTMQQFGVDLRLAGNMQQPVAPNVNELVQKGVQTELQKFQQQQELDRHTREWQVFEKDPAHPHCEQLKPLMVSLLNGGTATTYQDAYDQALRAHPTLHTTWVDQTLEQRNAKIKQENDAKRRAGSSLSGAPGRTAPTTQAKTGKNTREDIQIAIAQVRGSDI